MITAFFTDSALKKIIGQALLIGLLSLATAGLVNTLRPAPLAWNWSPPPPLAPVIENINEMRQIMAGPETVLVDAREAIFYRFAHLPGAISLPVAETDAAALEIWRKTLPPDANIIIYCSDSLCHMAEELAQKMMTIGLAPSVFAPGFDGWDMAGQPLESSPEIQP